MTVRELIAALEQLHESSKDYQVQMISNNPGDTVMDVVYGWDPVFGKVIFLDCED